MLKFRIQGAIGNNLLKELLPGHYGGLFLKISGTNAASQSLAASDFTFKLEWEGAQEINVPFSFLLEYCDQTFPGPVIDTSTSGGAFEFSCYLPANIANHPALVNSFHVLNNTKAFVGFDEGANVATKLSAGTYYVSTTPGNAPMKYVPRILQNNISFSAAGTLLEPISANNVMKLFVAGSTVTKIVGYRDGETFLNDTHANLKTLTGILNQQQSSITYADLRPGDSVLNLLNRDIQLEVTDTGAEIVTVIYVAAGELDTDQTGASAARVSTQAEKRAAEVQRVAPRSLPIIQRRPMITSDALNNMAAADRAL